MSSVRQRDGRDYVPPLWRLPTVQTVDDILFLGSHTIVQMVREWRQVSQGQRRRIKRVDSEIRTLAGKTSSDIIREATRFDNPEFDWGQIQVLDPRHPNDLEPTDPASIGRQRGSTTFNVCGWCRYFQSPWMRHYYGARGDCGLLEDAGLEISGWPIPEEVIRDATNLWPYVDVVNPLGDSPAELWFQELCVRFPGIDMVVRRKAAFLEHPQTQRRFNTPCYFKWANNSEIDRVVRGLRGELERLVREKREIDRKIRFLLNLSRRAEEKPILPHLRTREWFELRDPIVYYVGHMQRTIPEAWVSGWVVRGQGVQTGKIRIYSDTRFHTGPLADGHAYDIGYLDLSIMHAWEHEYLLEHPDFARIWVAYGPTTDSSP
ncbi:MAG: hypothetical protein HYV38_01690 [Candidatus Levybacteria bacterium]|nr:hypothetical protein [Candidatus Levybacteria bacterium]